MRHESPVMARYFQGSMSPCHESPRCSPSNPSPVLFSRLHLVFADLSPKVVCSLNGSFDLHYLPMENKYFFPRIKYAIIDFIQLNVPAKTTLGRQKSGSNRQVMQYYRSPQARLDSRTFVKGNLYKVTTCCWPLFWLIHIWLYQFICLHGQGATWCYTWPLRTDEIW